MKKSVARLSLLATLTALSTSALADESFDISVIGNITPAACKATIAGGNVFDYGDILAASLESSDFTVLPQKDAAFSIICDAPAKLALKTMDNRSGTKNNPIGKTLIGSSVVTANTSVLGLGLDPQGNKIGGYIAGIKANSVTTDTAASVDGLYSSNAGSTWTNTSIQYLVANANLFSWAKPGELTPLAFTTLDGTLSLQAAISPASSLDLSQPVLLNGSATVQLYYL